MAIVAFACVVLLIATAAIHYEVLRVLTAVLPALRIKPRQKLVLVIIGSFAAHFIEILLYGLAYYLFASTTAVVIVMWRRQFASAAQHALMLTSPAEMADKAAAPE